MRILSIGMVHPGPCGVRDHGALLAEELRENGDAVDEVWVPSDGQRLGRTLRATWSLLGTALTHRSSVAAIWHYSVFAYSYRGIPMPGILAGALLRLRGVHVVAILHEMALPWDTTGMRKLQAFCQHLVLPLVLVGADEIVVTTEGRAAWLRSAFRISRGRVHAIPVFSNFDDSTDRDATLPANRDREDSPIVAVPGWASSPGLESILLRAITEPELVSRGLTIELLGAPGPDAPAARRWLLAATATGVSNCLQFTGILTPEEFNQHLSRCDVAVLLFGDGPSTRHTMLAAALANGCATVALDGPDTWRPLVAAGAVAIAQPAHGDVARQIVRVLDDPEHSAALGQGARRFYNDALSLSAAARAYRLLFDVRSGGAEPERS